MRRFPGRCSLHASTRGFLPVGGLQSGLAYLEPVLKPKRSTDLSGDRQQTQWHSILTCICALPAFAANQRLIRRRVLEQGDVELVRCPPVVIGAVVDCVFPQGKYLRHMTATIDFPYFTSTYASETRASHTCVSHPTTLQLNQRCNESGDAFRFAILWYPICREILIQSEKHKQ